MMDENITLSDNSDIEDNSNPELRGYLSKWTNYIHGWQDRFIVLKDSTLSYYKSELESNLGCRGALCLKKAKVKPHEFDDCRFDVSVNDCVWYLRALNPEEKQQWIDVLESFKVINTQALKNIHVHHTRIFQLWESNPRPWTQKAGSLPTAPIGCIVTIVRPLKLRSRTSRRLAEKIAELDTYTELLSKQATQLQTYFDKCVSSCPQINDDAADAIDAVKLADSVDLKQYAEEVRATSASFRATCGATVLAVQNCTDLLKRREKQARQAEELYMALKNQLAEARLASKPGPDHEWSTLVTHWYPRDGQRKKGRQQRRWEDELKLTAGPLWRRVAQDRKHWRELEEAFAVRHTELRDFI
ncbi:jg16650 [Pararge aegeria aegeria]|uniref:Jg16650 protein n=1 Tax=Pararge aegeria aegeria TaxID=348720 RepID=A0A8S4RC30_9NEOP|nr:jg16650 [Pararge aegeria aegeria]